MYIWSGKLCITAPAVLGPQIPPGCVVIRTPRTELQSRTGGVTLVPDEPLVRDAACGPVQHELSEEQRAVVALAVDEGRFRSLAVGGGPGTGKSALVGPLKKALEAKGRKVTVLSTTGIAGEPHGATTVHSWLKLGLLEDSPEAEFARFMSLSDTKKGARRDHYARSDTLIIEEGSMLSDDILSIAFQVWCYFQLLLQVIGPQSPVPHTPNSVIPSPQQATSHVTFLLCTSVD